MIAKTADPDLELKRSLAGSIRKKMAQDNLSISALAERMGTGRTAVRRILDANNTSITFRSMSRAAQAVGLKVTLIAEPMSPGELGKMAHRLAGSKSRAEADRLSAQIAGTFRVRSSITCLSGSGNGKSMQMRCNHLQLGSTPTRKFQKVAGTNASPR
jgi:transcriptional regulator with XRE-family HTH domain